MANSSDDEVHSSQFVDAESHLDGNFDSHEEETARSGVQHAQPSSSATYNADWLSDLIGEAYAVSYSVHCVPGTAPKSLRMHAGHLWNPELRKAFKKLAWDILPRLLQETCPAWMHSIKMTRYCCCAVSACTQEPSVTNSSEISV